MARAKTAARKTSAATSESKHADLFELRRAAEPTHEAKSLVHSLGPGIICDTEPRGRPTPHGRSIAEIVVDASEGFIPLWAKDQRLRWRFQPRSMTVFTNPTAAKSAIRKLFSEALVMWGTAVPVRFTEDEDLWDFEIVMRAADNCNASGCVLASSFFPDAGRHKFVMYPKLFTQTREEQIDTFIHELGHVFGLRHFFALVSETDFPAKVFGTHTKFSIMNYGMLSKLTPDDKSDLRRLYQLAWTGALKQINGTPIRLVKPFNTLAGSTDSMVAVGQLEAVIEPQPHAAYFATL